MAGLTELLHAELDRRQRAHDGLLHASSHFVGSLRHVQLEVAGAPQRTEAFARRMPLFIGNAMHDLVHAALRGQPYMAEVDVTPWMPDGWGGTADAVKFEVSTGRWELRDYKSIAGRGMYYVIEDGAKEEHKAQTSLYWHALVDMGLEMADIIEIVYLPKDDGKQKDPLSASFKPLPKRALHAGAEYRRRRVHEYWDSLPQVVTDRDVLPDEPDVFEWLTDELEPVQEREQRVFFDKATETWDLKLVPHWSAAYCTSPDELCDCHLQGETKIGMFDVDGTTYIPRKGYEDIEPAVFPA